MIALNDRQHSALRALRSAGAAGLALNDGIAAGDAFVLDAYGLVTVDRGKRRVTITGRGASFLNRSAA